MGRAAQFGFLAASVVAACGGNEFASSAGGGGSTSGGAAGASASGGTTSGGAGGATGGAAGSATGGSGGTATGGSGGTATGGTGGTSTGGTGGTSTGGTGGSATGGTGGTTDGGTCAPALQGCGFSDPQPTLYSTLDDSASITQPARGSGSGQANGNYVCGACGHALHVTQAGEYARFPAQNNIFLDKGSVDFFHRPQHPQNDAAQHNLVMVPGKLQISIGVNGAFAVGVQRQDNTQLVTAIAATNFSYTAGQWIHIVVTWDFTQPGKNVHVYFDGNEIGANVTGSSGVQSMNTPNGGDFIYLCASGTNDSNNCDGEIDDFKTYQVVLSP